MGNTQPIHDPQKEGFFTALPEDIMILLTILLSLKDFVNLIATCKYYNIDLLGANNTLWARLFRSIGASVILKALQYSRRWKEVNVDGLAIDFSKELDVTDKRVLASIDFKKEIFDYYMLIINTRVLRQKIEKFLTFERFGRHPTIKVLPYSFWTSFNQYWTRADLKNKNARDFFYEVDLEFDPVSVEEHSDQAGNLPHEQGGRLVVYKKSNSYVKRKIISRTEVRDEFLDQQQLDLSQLTNKFQEAV